MHCTIKPLLNESAMWQTFNLTGLTARFKSHIKIHKLRISDIYWIVSLNGKYLKIHDMLTNYHMICSRHVYHIYHINYKCHENIAMLGFHQQYAQTRKDDKTILMTGCKWNNWCFSTRPDSFQSKNLILSFKSTFINRHLLPKEKWSQLQTNQNNQSGCPLQKI
jgi:hypothetical protein